MPNIDERVVQMTFDNKQFEKNVSQSLKTLDDLKKALELDKMNNSLQNLEQQTNDVSKSMSSLEATVSQVSSVFTPFGNLAFNALNRISNAALNVGENLLKMSLGIEGANLDINVPGQAKYEAYTKAVQTITNATGKSVDEVSKSLDKLSKYTDETSYDFSEMVSSIGKFTSVGIDLDRAEEAMEGIANWAAKSGAGKESANRAMYNISQAMGAGAMKKIDWKSIENANMATKEFKETAIETAIELGVLQRKGEGVGSVLEYTSKGVKETTVDYATFAETLKSGWLNTEVLMTTLQKYGDTSTEFGLSAFKAAQEALTFTDAIDALKDAVSSGWMKSLEYIFGNLDEARVMWTNFANALIEFAGIFSEQRNELLKGWHELGGYNMMVEAASNIWSVFMNIVLGVKEALEQVFPPTTAEQLVNMTEKVKDFTEQLSNAFHINTFTEVQTQLKDAVKNSNLLGANLHWGIFDPERVKALNNFLEYFGYLPEEYNNAAGKFGDYTEEAIKKLQRELSVTATGVWDEATRAAVIANDKFNDIEIKGKFKNIEEVVNTVSKEINHASELWQNLQKGDKNDWVRGLQEQLIAAGYALEKHGADGIYGAETEAAVKRLQQALGVEVTGAWDDATRSAAVAAQVFSEFNEVEETTIEKTQGLTGPMDFLQNIVRFLAGAVKTVVEIAKGALEIGWNIFLMLTPIFELLGKIGHLISQLVLDLTDSADSGQIIAGIVETILTLLSPLAYAIEAVTRPLSDFLDGFQNWLNMNKGMHSEKGTFWMLIHYLERSSAFKKNVKNFKKAFKTLKETVIDAFDKIKGIGVNIYDAIFGTTDVQKEGYTVRKKNITIFFENIVNIATWAVKRLTTLVDIIGKAAAGILNFFKNNVVPFIKGIKTAVIDEKVKSISGFFTTLWNTIKNTPIGKKLDEIKEKITGFFNTIKEFVQNKFPTLYKGIQTIKEKISKIFGEIGSIFKYMFEAFKSGRIKNITDFFTELKNAILSTDTGKKLHELYTNIKTFFDNLKKDIGEKGLLATMLDRFKETVLGKKFEEINAKVGEFFTKIKETIKEKFPSIYDFLKTTKDKIVNTFGDVGSIFSSIFEAFKGGKIKNITDFFTEFQIALLSTGTGKNLYNLYSNIKYFIENMKKTVAEKGIIGAITSALQSLFKWDPNKTFFENIGDKFDWLVEKIMAVKEKIAEAMRGLFSILTGKEDDGNFTSVFDKIKEFLDKNFKNFNWKALIPGAVGGLIGFLTLTSMGKETKGIEGLVSGLMSGNLFKSVGGKLLGAAAAIVGAITLLSVIPVDEVKEKIESALAFIRGKVSEFMEKIRELFTPNAEGRITVLDKLVEGFSSLKGILQPLVEFKNKIVGALSEIFKAVTGFDGDPKTPTIFDKIKEFVKGLKNIKIGAILGPALGIATIYGLVTSSKAFKNLSKGILQVISGNADLSVKKDTIGDTALKIAGAIAAVSVSVAILAAVPYEKAMKGLEVFGWLVAGTVAAMIVIDKFAPDGKNIGAQALMLAGSIAVLAIGLEMLAHVFSKITKENQGSYIAAGVAIVGMLVVLGLIEAGMARISKGNSGPNISGILQMCIGIGVLVLAFGGLVGIIKDNIDNKEVLIWATSILGGMLVLLGTVSVLVAALNTSGISKISGVLGLTIGIGILVLAFGKLVDIVKNNTEEDVNTTFSILNTFLIEIGAISVLMGIVSKNIATGLGVAGMFLSLGYAIKMIADSFGDNIVKIKDIDVELLKTFFEGIEVVVGEVSAIAGIFSLIPLPALIKGCLGLVIFIALLSKVGSQAIEDFGTALWLISSKLKNASSMTEQTNYDSLRAMGSYLKDDLPGILAATTELKVNKALQKMNMLQEFGASFQNYATAINTFNEGTLLSTAYAEKVAESASVIYNSIKDITETSGLATTLTDLGSALGAYYDEISQIGTDKETGEIKGIPTIDSEMVKNAFDALSKAIPKDDIDLISSYAAGGDNSLTKVALGIRAMGRALKNYSDNIGSINFFKVAAANTVINTFKGILDSSTTSSVTISSAFGLLSFTSEEKSNITNFANNITEIGNALSNYITATKDIDEKKITHANGVIAFISTVDQLLPSDAGLIGQLFAGKESLGEFASNFGSLGDGVANFAAAVNEADFTNVSESMTAIQTLAEVLNTLDAVGGIAGWVSGEKSLNAITKGLAGDDGVGAQISDFANRMKEFKYSDISQAITAIRTIIGIVNQTNEELTYVSDVGHNKIGDIGLGIREMMSELASITTDTVGKGKNAQSVLDAVSQLGPKLMETITNNILPKEGETNPIKEAIVKTIADAFVSITSNTAYSDPYAEIGPKLIKAISDNILPKEGETNPIRETIVKAIANAYTNLTSNTAYSDPYAEIGSKLIEAITNGILPKEGETNPIRESIVKTIANAYTNLTSNTAYADPYATIGDKIINSIKTGVGRTATSTLYPALNEIASTGLNAFTSQYESYVSAGNEFMQNLIVGMWRGQNAVYTTAGNISNNTVNEFGYKYNDYVNTGVDLMQGLIVGMWKGQKAVITTATNIGNAAHKALNKATGVASPSKKFKWTATMWDEGLVQGMEQGANEVYNTASGIGEQTVSYLDQVAEPTIEWGTEGLESNLKSGFDNFNIDDAASSMFTPGEGTTTAINNSVQTMYEGFKNQVTSTFQDDGTMSSTVESMVNGIWTNAKTSVQNAVSNAGDPKETILNTIQNAWKGITGENANFTLKPVLDFENMSIGGGTASNIVDYLKGIDENNATMLSANETANQAIQVKQDILETYVDTISNKVGVLIDRMETQTERIDQLGADMRQMKLVLNTGTLVGEIIPKIDRELGKRSAINARAR